MSKSIIMLSGRSPLEEIGGGHCSYVRAHAHAATAAGYDVHLYCVSKGPPGTHATPYGVVHHATSNGIPPRQRYIRQLADPLATAILADRDVVENAAAMHSFGVWAYAGMRALEQIPPPRRIRHVMSMYTVYREEAHAQWSAIAGFQPKLRFLALIEWLSILLFASRCEQKAYRASDTIAVNYHSVKKLVLNLLGPHPDLRIVPYTPEAAFSDPPSPACASPRESATPPAITTITLQRPKKGVRTFLDALALIKMEGIPFCGRIVGGGEMKKMNEQHAQAIGLGDSVEFPGFVPDVEPWLYRTDIYVQPSIREESGALALLEAMRIGRPVICSAIDGMAEDVRDGTDGLTVPPGDAKALANAIKHLLQHPAERTRFGIAARDRFHQRHAPETVSAMLKELYEPV